mgnify:CR=1 FL=1
MVMGGQSEIVSMAKPILPDALWEIVKPLLPPEKPAGTRGRPQVSNRQALQGILFVLKTGIPWEDLPQEMGCGSGMTCWRRIRDWHQAGVWAQLHKILLAKLHQADRIDWSRVVVDSASVRAVFGGPKPVRTPQTAGSWAANTTSSRRGKVFRFRFDSPARIDTTSRN